MFIEKAKEILNKYNRNKGICRKNQANFNVSRYKNDNSHVNAPSNTTYGIVNFTICENLNLLDNGSLENKNIKKAKAKLAMLQKLSLAHLNGGCNQQLLSEIKTNIVEVENFSRNCPKLAKIINEIQLRVDLEIEKLS